MSCQKEKHFCAADKHVLVDLIFAQQEIIENKSSNNFYVVKKMKHGNILQTSIMKLHWMYEQKKLYEPVGII